MKEKWLRLGGLKGWVRELSSLWARNVLDRFIQERELAVGGGVHSGTSLLSSLSLNPGHRVTGTQWCMRKTQGPPRALSLYRCGRL